MDAWHALAIAAATIGSSSAALAHDSCPNADAAGIIRVTEQFVTALADNDQQRLSQLVDPDLVVFDSGKRYEGMAIANMIGGLNRAGTKVKLTVNEPKVHQRCDMALVTFVDHGSLTTGDKVRSVSWLESAVLVHDGNTWRVRFEHATPVPTK